METDSESFDENNRLVITDSTILSSNLEHKGFVESFSSNLINSTHSSGKKDANLTSENLFFTTTSFSNYFKSIPVRCLSAPPRIFPYPYWIQKANKNDTIEKKLYQDTHSDKLLTKFGRDIGYMGKNQNGIKSLNLNKSNTDVGYLMVEKRGQLYRIPIMLDATRVEKKSNKLYRHDGQAGVSNLNLHVVMKQNAFSNIDQKLYTLFQSCDWIQVLSKFEMDRDETTQFESEKTLQNLGSSCQSSFYNSTTLNSFAPTISTRTSPSTLSSQKAQTYLENDSKSAELDQCNVLLKRNSQKCILNETRRQFSVPTKSSKPQACAVDTCNQMLHRLRNLPIQQPDNKTTLTIDKSNATNKVLDSKLIRLRLGEKILRSSQSVNEKNKVCENILEGKNYPMSCWREAAQNPVCLLQPMKELNSEHNSTDLSFYYNRFTSEKANEKHSTSSICNVKSLKTKNPLPELILETKKRKITKQDILTQSQPADEKTNSEDLDKNATRNAHKNILKIRRNSTSNLFSENVLSSPPKLSNCLFTKNGIQVSRVLEKAFKKSDCSTNFKENSTQVSITHTDLCSARRPNFNKSEVIQNGYTKTCIKCLKPNCNKQHNEYPSMFMNLQKSAPFKAGHDKLLNGIESSNKTIELNGENKNVDCGFSTTKNKLHSTPSENIIQNTSSNSIFTSARLSVGLNPTSYCLDSKNHGNLVRQGNLPDIQFPLISPIRLPAVDENSIEVKLLNINQQKERNENQLFLKLAALIQNGLPTSKLAPFLTNCCQLKMCPPTSRILFPEVASPNLNAFDTPEQEVPLDLSIKRQNPPSLESFEVTPQSKLNRISRNLPLPEHSLNSISFLNSNKPHLANAENILNSIDMEMSETKPVSHHKTPSNTSCTPKIKQTTDIPIMICSRCNQFMQVHLSNV